jgi:hypothetical protein
MISVKKEHVYQGIVLLVDKSGVNLASPTEPKPEPAGGPSKKEVITILTNAKPTPFLVTTS